jgi:hypothetical protein
MVWLVTNSREGLLMISVFYTVFYTHNHEKWQDLARTFMPCPVSLAIPAMQVKSTTGLSGRSVDARGHHYSPVSAILNITSDYQLFLYCLNHDVYFHQPSKS